MSPAAIFKCSVHLPTSAESSELGELPSRAAKSRALPVMGQEPQSQRAAVPAPTPVAYPQLGSIIAISSGKGGVGKSTVAVNLAVALAKQGARVGLMDADIYGPDIPLMLGLKQTRELRRWDIGRNPRFGRIELEPVEIADIRVMSVGFLLAESQTFTMPAMLASLK